MHKPVRVCTHNLIFVQTQITIHSLHINVVRTSSIAFQYSSRLVFKEASKGSNQIWTFASRGRLQTTVNIKKSLCNHCRLMLRQVNYQNLHRFCYRSKPTTSLRLAAVNSALLCLTLTLNVDFQSIFFWPQDFSKYNTCSNDKLQ